jgi:hypothetical protein
MTIREMKSVYNEANFLEEPASNYGVDGGGNGILVVNKGDTLFFIWKFEKDTIIQGIDILSPKVMIDSNIHVGMSYEDIVKKYPNAKPGMSSDNGFFEIIQIPTLNYSILFLTSDSNRLAEYDRKNGMPEFIKILRLQSKSTMIAIFN